MKKHARQSCFFQQSVKKNGNAARGGVPCGPACPGSPGGWVSAGGCESEKPVRMGVSRVSANRRSPRADGFGAGVVRNLSKFCRETEWGESGLRETASLLVCQTGKMRAQSGAALLLAEAAADKIEDLLAARAALARRDEHRRQLLPLFGKRGAETLHALGALRLG